MYFPKRMNRKKDKLAQSPDVYTMRVYPKDGEVIVKCGDCNNSLEIKVDHEKGTLEINGVYGTIKNWEKVILPLLQIHDGEE